MQIGLQARDSLRTSWGLVAGLRSRIAAARASDLATVAHDARFRALERRRTRAAARTGFLVIAAAVAFDAVALIDRQPSEAAVLVAMNGGVAALAMLGWWLVGGRARRSPDPLAAAVALALTAQDGGNRHGPTRDTAR